jgi:periplasmic protein CpxP/Spy
MKKLLIIALLGIGILGFAQKAKGGDKAQNSPEQKAEIRANNMKKSLGLSDQQTKEVKAILLAKIEKNSELRANLKSKRDSGEKLSKEEKAELKIEIKDEVNATKEDFKKILTPEQYAKYEEKMNDRKEKKKDKMENRKEKRANKKQKTEKK